jgi:hypothetical protein
MEDWRYKIAKKRVKKVKDFYNHLGTWLFFSAFFVLLNFLTSKGSFWAIWPIMGWGIGVAMHALGVFGFPGLGKDWEERMIEQEMDRIGQDEAQKRNEKGRLPEKTATGDEQMELKEVRKAWKDSDLV